MKEGWGTTGRTVGCNPPMMHRRCGKGHACLLHKLKCGCTMDRK